MTGNYAQFSRAILDGADLSRARFAYAQFDNASLLKANLSRAALVGASSQAADLRGADLRFADLSRGRLEEAARVDGTTLWRGTRYNQRTRWFDGARRRAPLDVD